MDERVDASIAGAFGAAMTALILGLAVLLAPPRPPVQVTRRIVIEGFASVIVGAVSAFYLAPAIAEALHVTHPTGVASVGFIVGVVAWRGLPLLITLVEAIARARASDLGKPRDGQ